jgi:muramoyltetrapeptide carboxypeptidase
MDIPTIQPPKLRRGDTVSIVAPASTVDQRQGFESGIAMLERMGFRVRFDERIFDSSRYLAGDDSARAEELMRAFENPSIQAIMALRGGYGCARLIPYLMEKRLRQHPKVFMGFSDITTLHMFLRRRFGWVTIHGPMAASIGNIPDEQQRHLISLWTDPEYHSTFHFDQMQTWSPGSAEGILVGGCLSIIATSIGTPYEIKTEGKILFLEDQGEPPYRIDRLLMHLHLAGKLQNLAGVVLGSFSDCEPSHGDYTASDTLREILTRLGVPVIAGFPAGHGPDNWAIPVGMKVRMDADARSIEFRESAVR